MSREYHHLTKDQKAAVEAEFAKLPLGLSYTDRIVAACKSAGVPIRKPDEDGKYYPSFFPWLKSVEKVSSVGGLSKPDRSAKKSRIQSAPTTAAATPDPIPDALCDLRAAFARLFDALAAHSFATAAARAHAEAVKIEASLQFLTPAPRATPKSSPREAGTQPSEGGSLHNLSDQQLKDRLGVAKAANNLGLCAKITNVLRMRDRSATVIANTHQEEV